LYLAVDLFYEYQQHNGFELTNVFSIDVPLATRHQLESLIGLRATPKIRRLLARPALSWATNENMCIEPHFEYWPDIHNIYQSTYVHGYWQSESYFIDIADVIRRDFTFRKPLIGLDLAVRKRMASALCASLHVRRGDYLMPKFKKYHPTCSISYYVSSVKILRDKFPDIKIFAFSDDPEWVLKHLEPELGQIEIVSHNSGITSANDMHLMSLADHHIIANSSFSWWAAWLNPSKEKVVISPKEWFANGRSISTLLPSSWLTL
jgi:hypothetical protein